MTFFVLLPISLVSWTILDIVFQRAFAHFISLRDLGRRLALLVALWLALGWLMEANAAITLAEITRECQVEVRGGIEDLNQRLRSFIQ